MTRNSVYVLHLRYDGSFCYVVLPTIKVRKRVYREVFLSLSVLKNFSLSVCSDTTFCDFSVFALHLLWSSVYQRDIRILQSGWSLPQEARIPRLWKEHW